MHAFRDFDGKNAYEVLGLPPSADTGTIRQTYRSKARNVHPDTCQNAAQKADAEELFKSVALAGEYLLKHRDDYDAHLQRCAKAEAGDPTAFQDEDADEDPWDIWDEARPGTGRPPRWGPPGNQRSWPTPSPPGHARVPLRAKLIVAGFGVFIVLGVVFGHDDETETSTPDVPSSSLPTYPPPYFSTYTPPVLPPPIPTFSMPTFTPIPFPRLPSERCLRSDSCWKQKQRDE